MMHFGRYGYGFMGNGFGIVAAVLASLVCIAVVALIVVIFIRLLKNKGHFSAYINGSGNNSIGNALAILNERYAKGEIGDEEYRKKKAEITRL